MSDLRFALRQRLKNPGFTWGDPPDMAGVNLGGVSIHLAQGKPPPNPKGCSVYFVIGDADELYEFHRANGVEVVKPPGDRPWELRDYTIRDPFGNELGFGHRIYNAGCPVQIERVDVPVRLEKRLAALLHDLAEHKHMSLNSCLEETLLHTFERVAPGQSVVVRGDRIVAIGAAANVSVPDGATIIDGAGRYLLPGLTDAHVHLPGLPFAPSRPDFGDAPLYLAFGVTTVLNMGGSPTILDWRRRIETGELLGPDIYTAGPFFNEPRANTPEEVQREVDAEVRDGYDFIKFRELPTTTRGLTLPAYRKLHEAARSAGVPLVGHAPVYLGTDALLEARQNLAHAGALSNIYFLPLASNSRILMITGVALSALVVLVAILGVAAIIGRGRGGKRSPTLARVRVLTGLIVLAGVLGLFSAALFLPGGPWFESLALRLLFTIASGFIVVVTVMLGLLAARMWRDASASLLARTQASFVFLASLMLSSPLACFWVPVAWRSSDSGIERLARRVKESELSVQTTLINYGFFSTPQRLMLINEPAIDYLADPIRTRWRGLPQTGRLGNRYSSFMRKVTAALHQAGVPLVAGTDAMGFPLIVPGASLPRELQLLTESGLTPFEAIHAATVNPAVFLCKDNVFGTIAEGKRADLLLVEGNPLQDLTRLKQPVGVMVRGKWLTRENLQQPLATLRGPSQERN